MAGAKTLFLKEVWPDAKLLAYFEFWYNFIGSDMGFDPEFPSDAEDAPRLRAKNAINLLGLDAADAGQTPTRWQRDQYPTRWHDMLTVVHEGIDTDFVAPNPYAKAQIGPRGPVMQVGDELITFVTRNIEPLSWRACVSARFARAAEAPSERACRDRRR